MRPILAPCLAFLLLAGCTKAPPPADPGTDTEPTVVEDSAVLTAFRSDFLEVNLNVTAGTRISYNWTAGGPLYFDFHHHSQGQVKYLEQGTFQQRSGTVTAPVDGLVSAYWENPNSQTYSVDYRIEGVYEVHSVQEPRQG